jgi:predicted nucleotidyltransferase
MAEDIESEIIEREPVLGVMVRRLVEVYSPLRIYLFGSKARGDDGPDSDYDLLVVIPDDAPEQFRSGGVGHAAIGAVGVSKDILVCTIGFFERRSRVKASLPATVLREGKLLYAK